ncbi:CINP protein, partial [Amia calva]|nr:CINP protein [Amia calva]
MYVFVLNRFVDVCLCFAGKSPGNAKTCRKPVLNNSARKIKDNAADWHNFILKWDKLNDAGFTIANKIVNLKINKDAEKSELKLECEGPALPSPDTKPPGPNPELQEECTALLDIVEKMAGLVSKMEKLSSSVKGICELERFQCGEGGRASPLFNTWTTAQFDQVSSRLCESYRQELKLKQTTVQEIAHTSDRNLSMVYLWAWLYQPYVEDCTKVDLEGMLLETGHRPL